MSIFLDASAMVSMIAGEEDAVTLSERLDAHEEKMTSAIAYWETVVALSRSHNYAPDVASDVVRSFIDARVIRINPISFLETQEAISAYKRYGKGRDPAGLNMGDCFAYASAKTSDADLLYKGNDFAQTDLA
jgi:ribonuclease VapC